MENTFGIPIIPANEEKRLAQLHSFDLTANDSIGKFHHIAAMASYIFDVPLALVSIVDRESVLFRGAVGMGSLSQVDRGAALCSLAVINNNVTVFEDTKEVACLARNPFVNGEFGLRFYAAAPIITPDGFNIGVVCIGDRVPRTFSDSDKIILQNFATIVMDELAKLKTCH